GEHVFRSHLLLDAGRRDRRVPCLDDRLKRATLVRGVAFHCLDQVWNKVVALLELHVDVGKGLVGPLPHGDETVVDGDRPDDDHGNDTEHDPTGGGHETAPDWESGESLNGNSLSQERPRRLTATG